MSNYAFNLLYLYTLDNQCVRIVYENCYMQHMHMSEFKGTSSTVFSIYLSHVNALDRALPYETSV